MKVVIIKLCKDVYIWSLRANNGRIMAESPHCYRRDNCIRSFKTTCKFLSNNLHNVPTDNYYSVDEDWSDDLFS